MLIKGSSCTNGGTFTSLQDEQGGAIGGINVDDEPVPGFVWQYANRMVAGQYSNESRNLGLPPYNADGGKGWTVGDPTVTIRLETPVIYIYPPKGQAAKSVPPLDVHVDFHGGVLSQYYPYAETNGADLNGEMPYLQKQGVTKDMTTGLTWKGVRLDPDTKPFNSTNRELANAPYFRGAPVETNDKVWTTPREVSAPLLGVNFTLPDYAHPGLNIPCAQAEHFLFYRGVGHLDSPLRILDQKDKFEVGSFRGHESGPIGYCWLVEIHPDGTCAFRYPIFAKSRFDLPKIKSSWSTADFTPNNLAKLKASMHDALVQEGLYDDEATAMLKTWELSYFKSPGLRFFYIVPRTWTDKVLPLKITGAPTDITRVMIGRIELITDSQKAALQRLSDGPCPDLRSVKQAALDALEKGKLTDPEKEAYYRGEKPLSELGIAIPPLVQDYLSLGRFRDALVVHEQQLRPSLSLAQFIKDNGLLEKEYETIQPASLQTKSL